MKKEKLENKVAGKDASSQEVQNTINEFRNSCEGKVITFTDTENKIDHITVL